MRQPLEGVRVVEFGSFTAGPLCGEVLAQLGAQVVKVEPPDGDHLRRLATQIEGVSYLYHINNAGKRSVAADLKRTEGRAAAMDLAADADVLIENFAPGTLERHGLGYAAVRSRNPTIVYCSVNGFGRSGPLKDERAYDVVIQGLSGMVSLCGHDPERPVKAGPSIVDMMGAVVGASAVVAALIHRLRTGEGQSIEVAMYDVACWLTAEAWPDVLQGEVPKPGGNRNRNGDWQGVFSTQDGFIVVATRSPEERAALTRLTQCTDRPEADERLRAAVARWCAAVRSSGALGLLRSAGICAAPVMRLNEVFLHPQFRERGVIREMKTQSGRSAPIFGSPLRLSKTPGVAQGFAEPVGASTETVLAEARSRLAARNAGRDAA